MDAKALEVLRHRAVSDEALRLPDVDPQDGLQDFDASKTHEAKLRRRVAEIADADADVARATRARMLAKMASTGALVLGTHFPTRPGGRVVVDGDVWRFVAE